MLTNNLKDTLIFNNNLTTISQKVVYTVHNNLNMKKYVRGNIQNYKG